MGLYSQTGRHALKLALVLLNIVAAAAHSQQRLLIGRVRDDLGVPVPEARVELVGSFRYTVSSVDGTFRLAVDTSEFRIRVKRIGYQSSIVSAGALGPDTIEVLLVRRPTDLRGILVSGEGAIPMALAATRATVRQVPPLGETDIIRVLPFMPGVSQPNDMLGRLYLAGSTGDETLFMIDDHPLQSAVHLDGIVSSFNVAALDRAEVRAHHIPAVSDARVGGAIALESRQAERGRVAEGVISLLSSSLTVLSPSRPGGSELLASGRATYIDKLLEHIGTAGQDPDIVPTYRDALVRFTTEALRSQIDVLGFGTWDRRKPGPSLGAKGMQRGEMLAGITARQVFDRWLVTLRLSTDYAWAADKSLDFRGRPALDIAQEWTSGKVLVSHALDRGLSWSMAAGIDTRKHVYSWSTTAGLANPLLPERYEGTQTQELISVAAQTEVRSSPTTRLDLGVVARSAGKATLAPRLRVAWMPRSYLTLDVAAETRNQFDAQFGETIEGGSAQPVFLLDAPRKSNALSSTLEFRNPRSARSIISMQVTPFIRLYPDRTTPKGIARDTILHSQVDFNRVRGRSFGISSAMTVNVWRGALVQMSYTFARAEEHPDSIWQPASWDIPHTLAAFANVQLRSSLLLTAAFQLHSGNAVVPLATRILVPNPVFPDRLVPRHVYGSPNSGRLPGYQRLDFALRKSWRARGMKLAVSLQAMNILARTNAHEYDWYRYLARLEGQDVDITAQRGLPFVPSAGLEIIW